MKIRRQELSPDQPPLTGEELWVLSPRSGGSFASVSESISFLLYTSQWGDDNSFRFLVEDVTVNNYKRTCYWHQEKGEETLAEPQLCAKLLARALHTSLFHFILTAFLWYYYPHFSDHASQRPYNFAQHHITWAALSSISHIRSF